MGSSKVLVMALLFALMCATECAKRIPRQGGFTFENPASTGGGDACSTPDGQVGECIEIVKCEAAAAILAGRPTPAQRKFLTERTCRFDGAVPFFCCVRDSGSGGDGATPAPPKTPAPPPPPVVTQAPPPVVTEAPPVPPVQPPTEPPTAPVPRTDETPSAPSGGDNGKLTLGQIREVCGVSKAPLVRIVGGEISQLEYWPWMAALFIADKGESAKTFVGCGAVLISDRYVLTAAHCVIIKGTGQKRRASDVTVRLGDLDILRDDDGATPIDLVAEELIPHPEYNAATVQNDIALVKLPQNVEFTKLILPICLPTAAMESNSFETMRPHIAGWGTILFQGESSSALRHVQLEAVTSNMACQDAYRRFKITISPSQLCAGTLAGGKDACQGDSGGPLMLPRSKKWTSIGVVSVGFRCAERGFPGIYARTTFYLDWIKENAHLSGE